MITLLINLCVVAVVVYVLFFIIGLIPMDATIKRIAQVIISLIVFLWLLQMFGIWHGFTTPVLR